MMAFLQISLLLLMACFMKLVGCQQLFSVQVLSPRMVNNVTIRCEESNGDIVTDGLVFYRNGINQLEDRCLSAGKKLDDGKFMLQVSPSCEGHYMCGTSINGGAKLSGPSELYGEYISAMSMHNSTASVAVRHCNSAFSLKRVVVIVSVI